MLSLRYVCSFLCRVLLHFIVKWGGSPSGTSTLSAHCFLCLPRNCVHSLCPLVHSTCFHARIVHIMIIHITYNCARIVCTHVSYTLLSIVHVVHRKRCAPHALCIACTLCVICTLCILCIPWIVFTMHRVHHCSFNVVHMYLQDVLHSMHRMCIVVHLFVCIHYAFNALIVQSLHLVCMLAQVHTTCIEYIIRYAF